MNKPNMYELIRHLPLEKVVAIESVEQESYQIEDADILECKDISTIPAPTPTQPDLFTRLTSDLTLPPISPPKCDDCKEHLYMDHDLVYCTTCHYPLFYSGNPKTEGKKMEEEKTYPGVGLLIVVGGSLLLWVGIFYGVRFLLQAFQ